MAHQLNFKTPFKTPFNKNVVKPAEKEEKSRCIPFKPKKIPAQTVPVKRTRHTYVDESDEEQNSSDGSDYNSESAYSESDKDSDTDVKRPRKKTKGSQIQKARVPLAKLSTRSNNASKNTKSSIPLIHHDPIKTLTSRFKIPTFKSKGDGQQPIPCEENNDNQKTLGIRRRPFLATKALYDHTAENALVLHSPSEEEEQKVVEVKEKKEKTLGEILGVVIPKNENKVHVVLDPRLTAKLRPHQREGVKFLYECTTGRVVPNAYGCIMADEMGLGKTLQCIALMWTLLRQSSEPNKGTIEKCIIVCPSSLVRNWANEIVKWLGPNAIRPLAMDSKGTKENTINELRKFANAQGRMIMNPVLIISYETLRINISELSNGEIGLLLCDEGHRLKNSDSLLFQALNSLKVQRRVILSGTPIQNDLSEYFSLLNFANPGLLGTPSEFRRNYENAIIRGRDADATDREREISDQKLSELWGVVSKFIIRRTNDILSKFLPPKYEHVVFCRLSKFQLALYNLFVTSPEIQRLLRGVGSQPLKGFS